MAFFTALWRSGDTVGHRIVDGVPSVFEQLFLELPVLCRQEKNLLHPNRNLDGSMFSPLVRLAAANCQFRSAIFVI